MIVTWTALRTGQPVTHLPWQPDGAQWWQAGHSGSGRLDAPVPDGRWWSVLATWPTRDQAEVGPRPRAGLDAWHVVLDATSFRGDAVLAGAARPFDSVGHGNDTEGALAVVTFAGIGADSSREREFFRRFMHIARSIGRARGHLAGLIQVPDDGAVLTFSVWEDQRSALDWAYVQPAHAAAVERNRTHRLVDASGSLRCTVLSSSGSLGDTGDPLARRRRPDPCAARADA